MMLEFRRSLLRSCSVLAAVAVMGLTAPAQGAKDPVDPTIKRISAMVGGVWRGHVGPASGGVDVEFRYTWHPDGRGIRSEGIIGKGSKSPMHTFVQFGVDGETKKVYYLDTHNSSTVYYGYIHFEGNEFVTEFGPAGGNIQSYLSRGHWPNKDTYTFTMWSTSGGKKEIMKDVTLHRTR